MVRPRIPTALDPRSLRLAGILYVLVALIGPIGLMVVPDRLFVIGQAAATADAIRASGWLLNAGIGCNLLHQTIEAFLVIELYRCFAPVDARRALQMAVLGLIPIPIVFLNSLNLIAVGVLLNGADFLAPFTHAQLESLAYLCVRLHSRGLILASVFWGVWLLPLAALAHRSGRAPRAIGPLVALAGVAYVLDAIAVLVVPALRPAMSVIAMPLEALELVFIGWLLWAGFGRSGRFGPSPGA